MKDEEIEECIKQTFDVEFLTEKWEKEQYAAALVAASEWGRLNVVTNKKSIMKHLAMKYNNQS